MFSMPNSGITPQQATAGLRMRHQRQTLTALSPPPRVTLAFIIIRNFRRYYLSDPSCDFGLDGVDRAWSIGPPPLATHEDCNPFEYKAERREDGVRNRRSPKWDPFNGCRLCPIQDHRSGCVPAGGSLRMIHRSMRRSPWCQRVAWRRKRRRRPHSPLMIMRRGRSPGVQGRAFG
jgi:hypothetical protein